MLLSYQNVHRLELHKFWIAHLSVKREIRMRFNVIPVFPNKMLLWTVM